MNTNYHPTNQLLTQYANGDLPEAYELLIATHISMCDECRTEIAALDALGGAVLQEFEPLETVSFAQTLEKIKQVGRDVPKVRVPTEVPAPLVDYIGSRFEDVRWKPIGIGARQAILNTDGGATARLLHIPAGSAMPNHTHQGLELTLVLRGAFYDGETRYGQGDIEVADEDDLHTPIADRAGPCICLAATDAPLKFTSLLPRLAQPFFKI